MRGVASRRTLATGSAPGESKGPFPELVHANWSVLRGLLLGKRRLRTRARLNRSVSSHPLDPQLLALLAQVPRHLLVDVLEHGRGARFRPVVQRAVAFGLFR